MVIGVLPFGLAIGATLATTSLSATQAVLSAVAILAGAAQLTTVSMLDQGVAPAVIITSALIINARLALYSASIAPWFRHEPLRRRLLLAVFVIDQTYFTAIPRFQRGDLNPTARAAYYLTGGAILATSFVSAQFLAMNIGSMLPPSSGIGVAAPLALAGLAAKAMVERASTVAAIVASVVAVVAVPLPFQSSILLAIVVGLTAGVITDRNTNRNKNKPGRTDPDQLVPETTEDKETRS
jgi:predicted branched-subunit amino acid permease